MWYWVQIVYFCFDCGDGLNDGEACDDGNFLDGDGCSHLCTVETGFQCGKQLANPLHFNCLWGWDMIFPRNV